MKTATVWVALASLALIGAALASHAPLGRCTSEAFPAAGVVEFTGGSADTTFYVDDRSWFENGIWIYAETNGVWAPHIVPGVFVNDDGARHNLQRGGGTIVFALRPPADPAMNPGEICVDDPFELPDMLVL